MSKMFLTMDEVKDRLGKTEEQVMEFVRQGRLRDFRDGLRIMFKADRVENLAAELGISSSPVALQANLFPQASNKEESSEEERLLLGISEQRVKDLIHDLLRTPSFIGTGLTTRCDVLCSVIVGKPAAPEAGIDAQWIKACKMVVDRLPNKPLNLMKSLLIQGEEEDEHENKKSGTEFGTIVSLSEEAVNILVSAWSEKKELSRTEAEKVLKGTTTMIFMRTLDFWVRAVQEEYVKLTFDPLYNPNDILAQISTLFDRGDLTSRSRALIKDAVAFDIRSHELSCVVETISRSIALMPK